MYPKDLKDIPDRRVRARVAIERRIVKATVDAFLAAGFALQTDQGGGPLEPVIPTRDRQVILDALCETDDERLYVRQVFPGPNYISNGWVYFVYGNDGWDVISDYTTNLEEVLKPVNALAESLDSDA